MSWAEASGGAVLRHCIDWLTLPSGVTRPAESGHAPVVFVHGLGVPSIIYKVLPLRRAFAERGFPFLVAGTPRSGTIEERARVLRDEIERMVPSGPLHLVAHSMGGLDARLAIARFGLGDRVISLTTFSTPHRGSEAADFVVRSLDRVGRERVAASRLARLFASDLAAIRELTRDYVTEVFNPAVPDDPRVRYQSLGFFIPRPVSRHSAVPLLLIGNRILESAGEKENDGLVGIESARWGEDLGTYPGDHYTQLHPVPSFGLPTYRDSIHVLLGRLEALEETMLLGISSAR